MDARRDDPLASRFEEHRGHLRAVAYRMLGSASEADDAVQEAWLRLSRSGAAGVENLGGWLTTVVARVCLDMLRSRRSRREEPLETRVAEPPATAHGHAGADPEREMLLADSIGIALLVVLETLAPSERVAFVLHDLFDVPFEDIAPIVGRSADAARQLASRARRRVQGGTAAAEADRTRQREVVAAFLAAARSGDIAGLLAVLDPDVLVRADEAAVQLGAHAETRGAPAAAAGFAKRSRGAQPAVVAGEPGAVWAPGGTPKVAFVFTVGDDGRIVEIELVADAARLGQLDLVL